MNHPYTPVSQEVSCQSVRERREQEYAAGDSYEILQKLAGIIGMMLDETCPPRRYRGDMHGTRIAYTQERIDMHEAYPQNRMTTKLEIDLTLPSRRNDHRTPKGMVEGYSLWIWQEDAADEVVIADEYRLRRFGCGLLNLSVLKDIDGIADALRWSDPLAARPVDWRDATVYEVNALIEDLEIFHSLAQGPDGDRKWYDIQQ
ncbi:MAG TPA: hypothetical protein VK978_03785 [Candidatus Saccharimonadales bacterium]|nr:hypothetical protein [Candidatus Saccharimonadales bacterium]